MPIALSKLGKKPKYVTVTDVDGEGGSMVVLYAPGGYTPALEQKMRAAVDENLPGKMLATMVGKIITGWDLVEPEESAQARVDEKNQPLLDKWVSDGKDAKKFVPKYKLPEPTNPGGDNLMYPVPINSNTIQEIPISILSRIVEEVAREQRPEAEQSEDSGSFS